MLDAWFAATGMPPADDRFDTSKITDPLDQQLYEFNTTGPQIWLQNFFPPQIDLNGNAPAQELVLGGQGDGAAAGADPRARRRAVARAAAGRAGELADLHSRPARRRRARREQLGRRARQAARAQLRRAWPYLLIAPAAAFIGVVFLYSLVRLGYASVHTGDNGDEGPAQLDGLPLHPRRPDLPRRRQAQPAAAAVGAGGARAGARDRASSCTRAIRGWRVYRTIVFLPYMLAIPVLGTTFVYLLSLNGALNETLRGGRPRLPGPGLARRPDLGAAADRRRSSSTTSSASGSCCSWRAC